MTCVRISHVCFTSVNIYKTRNFYEELLGLKVVHEFRNDDGELYGLYFRVGQGTFLEFFQGRKESSDIDRAFRHICLVVDNLTLTVQSLNLSGYACTMQRGRTDGTLQTWVEDPNGIKIEFHEYDEKSSLTKYQDI